MTNLSRQQAAKNKESKISQESLGVYSATFTERLQDATQRGHYPVSNFFHFSLLLAY